jgi:hypothetical protein
MALHCTQAKRGTLTAPIGEVWRIRSANKDFSLIFVYSLRFAH